MSALLGSVDDHVTPSNNNCCEYCDMPIRPKLQETEEYLMLAVTVYVGGV